jgi:hypothetical protein
VIRAQSANGEGECGGRGIEHSRVIRLKEGFGIAVVKKLADPVVPRNVVAGAYGDNNLVVPYNLINEGGHSGGTRRPVWGPGIAQ